MPQKRYRDRLKQLFSQCPCRIELPDWYEAIANKRGVSALQRDERRRFVRFYFPTSAILQCRPTLPTVERDGEPQYVLTKDLSRSGIAFLHYEQIYPEEVVVLWLPDARRQFIVTRCRRHNRRCYEIGARIAVDQPGILQR